MANPRERCGARFAGESGVPRPSGAGATRHPRASRGIGVLGSAFPDVMSATRPGFAVIGRTCQRLWFARRGHHATADGSTQTTSAMYWAHAATITSAWKTSWNPNHRGHGSGRWRA